MDDGVIVVMVVFSTILFISFFRFAYRVIALFVDKKQRPAQIVEVVGEDQTDLNLRAYELQRRMQNLEEILATNKGVNHG